MKKIISIFIVFIILISTVLTAPAHAVAVEIIGGSYVAYAILAAALAAAGYTIAANQLDPDTFQGILDSSGAEDVKMLITATTVFASVNGRVFFNWTAQQWATFVNWCNNYVASGSISLPASTSSLIVNSSTFQKTVIDSYLEKGIPTTNYQVGWYIGNCRAITYSVTGSYLSCKLCVGNNNSIYFYNPYAQGYYYTSGSNFYVYGSPIVASGTDYFTIYCGMGVSNGSIYYGNSVSNVTSVFVPTNMSQTINTLYLNGVNYSHTFNNGIITFSGGGHTFAINGTENFSKLYSSYLEWFTDVINTGALVGDWSGIGNDVINPADNDVTIDIDPPYQVGIGADAIPDSIDGSIDFPLNPYVETDLGPDVVDPYVDFTPWDSTVIPPDDVVPDVRLNPPADVTANPDIPWADDQTYPLDYPTDTTTDDLPPGNNPNPDPSSDDKTNRLKLGPLLLSKFPFCLPWDLQHSLKVLIAPAEAPVFIIPIVNQRLGINESLTIDLSFADRLAQVTRWFLSALWVVILILITSKIIWK